MRSRAVRCVIHLEWSVVTCMIWSIVCDWAEWSVVTCMIWGIVCDWAEWSVVTCMIWSIVCDWAECSVVTCMIWGIVCDRAEWSAVTCMIWSIVCDWAECSVVTCMIWSIVCDWAECSVVTCMIWSIVCDWAEWSVVTCMIWSIVCDWAECSVVTTCLVHWCWLWNGAVCEDVIIYRWTAMKMRSASYSWLSVTCAWCDCHYRSIYVSTYACINSAIYYCLMHICSTCLLVHKINKLLSLSLSSQCRPFSRRHTRIHVFSQGIRRFALRTGRNRQLFTEEQFKGECGYLHRTIIPSHIDRLSSLSSERLIFASSSFNDNLLACASPSTLFRWT